MFSALRSLHLSAGFVGVWPSSRARPGSDAVNGEPTQLPTPQQRAGEVGRAVAAAVQHVQRPNAAFQRVPGVSAGTMACIAARGCVEGSPSNSDAPAGRAPLIGPKGPASPTSCTALPNLAPTLNTQKTYRPPFPTPSIAAVLPSCTARPVSLSSGLVCCRSTRLGTSQQNLPPPSSFSCPLLAVRLSWPGAFR